LAALLSTLVMTTALAAVLVPVPAAADQIADLKARASQISQALVQEQLQIGAYQQQYSVASAKVATDDRSIAQIGQQIGREKRRIDKETSVVRQLAIVSYMDAGSELSGSDAIFTGNMQKVELANEYTTLSAGNIDTALSQLHTAQRSLDAHHAVLQQEQAKDRSDQTEQATYLAHAVSSETQMEAEQAEVTGQLATAVAAQAAAQAEAAAAAVAAAQKAALQATVTVVTAAPTAVSGPDPALNPYLQCVVQAESGGNYGAVSPNGLYMGAFQFSQATWNMAAEAAGLSNLVGVRPNTASRAEQDDVAIALYALDGEQPWLGDRCSS
jgi:peptidoglycan hydrolase CwlO-like protein